MKYNTATEKLRAVNEGKMAKGEFVRQMRLSFPNSITQFNGFKDTVQILKNKGLVFEDYKKENNNKSSKFFSELMEFYTIFHKELYETEDTPLHDPCVIAYLLKPSIVPREGL